MSRYERTGERDLTVSAWHRSLPDNCSAIDVDFLEYCNRCRAPLAVIELAKGHHQTPKPTTVLRHLAETAGIRAYLILYDLDAAGEYGLAPTMRVARVCPQPTALKEMPVAAVGKLIVRIHDEHICPQTNPLTAHPNGI